MLNFFKKAGLVIALLLIVFVAGLIGSMLFGWLIMLSIGILAANGVVGGTVGLFWDGLVLGLIFSTLLSFSTAANSRG